MTILTYFQTDEVLISKKLTLKTDKGNCTTERIVQGFTGVELPLE